MKQPVYYYMFDPASGVYLGYNEASENPEVPGSYFTPYGSTLVEPPVCTEKQVAVWRLDRWFLLYNMKAPVGTRPSFRFRFAMAWDLLFGKAAQG